MKSLQLGKRNRIKLAVSLICLLAAIFINFWVVSQWFWLSDPLQTLVAVLSTIVISTSAISALRSVTKTYRVFCICFPLAATLVPFIAYAYGLLGHMDPTDQSQGFGMVLSANVSYIFTVCIITGAFLAILSLLWELKKAGIIGAKKVRAVGGVLAK